MATDKPAAKRQTTARRRGRKPAAGGRSVAQVQSLNRGLALLERIADNADGVTLTDIAQQVGLAPSTTHRLLLTLAQSGYVRQNEELGKWYVGVKAFTVGNAFLGARDIVESSRPFLHKLMEATGETANLAVLEGGEAVIVSQVECHELMRMVVPLGTRTPVHASGLGKALLLAISEFEVAAILHQHGLTRYTEHTLDTPAKLKQNLQAARKAGYVVDNEEHAVGLRCVAAPVYDEQGRAVAAISISGPRSRIPDTRLRELGALTGRIAREVTDHIGGHPPSQA
jgi:IclR family acetate operon transcriptional repressor